VAAGGIWADGSAFWSRGVNALKLLLPENQTKIDLTESERQDVLKSAIWVTCSPHEWQWTTDEQAAMARYCLWATQRLDMIQRIALGQELHHPDSAQE